MIVVNFKTYPQATGVKAVDLARICQQVMVDSGVEIMVGVQASDINRVAAQVKIKVFGQHLDPLEPGRHTGFTTAFSLKQAGAAGVFLNHSEHPFTDLSSLEQAVKLAKKESLLTLVFAKDLAAAQKIDQFSPTYIALEEPSMVSGDVAMVELPHLRDEIKDFSQEIKSVPLLGAGIKTDKDVKQSLGLGVKGIAIASGVIKVDDPKKALLSLASAFK